MTHASRFALVLLLIAGICPAAEAQIYSWRDANGVLVLSNRPMGRRAETFEVPGTRAVRTTRPATAGWSAEYADLIDRHAAAYRVRPELVRAVIQTESGFDPRARSPKGALGLMQLMPATASEFGLADAFDPAENIRAGVAYLARLLTQYQGNEELALAAYNAGPGAVERYGTRVPPYRETKAYVNKIKAATALTTGAHGAPRRNIFYKSFETIHGRTIPRYSNVRPAVGNYEIVGAQR